ncbi:MAG: M28 family peptidase [Gemmatimonadota bacterium]|nr:MAG: M28 family peptidase [Gemmatimonadota bacterium]
MTVNRLVGVAALVLLAASCGEDPALTAALDMMTAEELAAHVEILSADSLEGRGPSSVGEERTIAYLEQQFRAIGLEPGNGDSYLQEVPLVSITARPDARLTIAGGGRTTSYRYGREFMAWTTRVVSQSTLNASEMIFVGYGIVAPEYDWNDYAGVDVTGKTVVILVNDPGFATKDTALFNGNAMTYYGRWTYKYEEAARQGAAGALIIHETEAAGYPWAVVESSWSGPQFDLVRDDNNMSRVAVEGWLTLEAADAVFTQAGLNRDSLAQLAHTRDFRAVAMPLRASVRLRNTLRRSTSNNVLGVLPGGERADEYVVFMAHWDHLGIDPSLEGDQIYNGALDNATGTAGLLELAKAFASLETRPPRSILFLAVTAEEQGLLGSAHYAANPTVPLATTVAAINMDGLNIYGPMNDVTVIGLGNSELDDYLEAAARQQGRRVRPDPEAEKGFYFRSDHFNFAKQGVPALYTDQGIDHVEHGEAWTMERRAEYTAENYHKPSDEYDVNWDLTGAVDDLRLLFRVGYTLAQESTFPNWREGVAFKAKRDSVLAGGE